MQLLAIDDNADLILALHAEKKVTYRCPDCLDPVFLRSGEAVQPHFFHKQKRSCRHDAKGLDHLQIQVRIQKELQDSLIEERFKAIGRVADICSHALKLVIEIQCSSISLIEIKTRTADYESLGYRVLWILHTKKFFQERAGSVEKFLERKPHYFTDIDEEGLGVIFDQLSFIQNGRRHLLGEALPLSFASWPISDLAKERRHLKRRQCPTIKARLRGYLLTAFRMLLENSCSGK